MNMGISPIRQILQTAGKSAADFALPEEILLESGAVRRLAGFIHRSGYRSIALVTDALCLEAAGQTVMTVAEQTGIPVNTVVIHPNAAGDVIADEASVVQTLLEIQRITADVCVALGSGTVHDITRYAAYTSRIPFISVPTAPSVDGFTSRGAPLIVRGDKITVPAVGPVAIFADLDILAAAPVPMIAAGFGDMLGKYTSLFDWKFGHLAADEPYDPFVYEMTERALKACVDNAGEIGRRTPEGVAILMQALIESGIAMLIFGQSHPASGAEHHLSHYWEMEFIRTGRRQLLHGAKVGAACAIITDKYKQMAKEGPPQPLANSTSNTAIEAASEHWPTIRQMIAELPDSDTIRTLLCAVNGPADIHELGIDPPLRDRALQEADNVRPGRTTLLRVYNIVLRDRKK